MRGLVVNLLGEVFRNGVAVDELCSISAQEYPEAFTGSDRQQKSAANRIFATLLRESCLTTREKRIVRLVWEAQKMPDAVVRVQHYNNAVRVTAEFSERADNQVFWRGVEAVAKAIGARVTIMDEYLDRECQWKDDQSGREIPGSREYGPNYGKRIRQVDVNLRVDRLSIAAVKEARTKLLRATRKLWKHAGVAVI